MDDLERLIASKDYMKLVEVCQGMELASHMGDNNAIPLTHIYSLLLAAYTILGNISAAQFLHKRMNGQSSEEIEAIWAVVTSLSRRHYPDFYRALSAFEWPTYLQPLIADLKDTVQQRMLFLIAKGYTNIHVTEASQFFGMPEDELLKALQTEGWQFDASSGLLKPVVPELPKRAPPNLSQFNILTDVMLNLEKI
ncbi:COP9 signalosome [Syncephalastrum racemosum]|uniref:COP9 signalosome complex subunit 8 n=1 Tax=Syncephalastrum racemosum TaxID=13706 RepID=A0A1X2HPW0_SYNRA|nr:COP9 signalosome [Syncephalastrum racemosum]